jgi:hypothetical protein
VSSADSKSLVCWKPSSLIIASTTTGAGTTTGTTGGYGVWQIGDWSPSTCTTKDIKQTRTVTCSSDKCASPAPVSTQDCPKLYNGLHYESECKGQGGSVLTAENGDKYCSLSLSLSLSMPARKIGMPMGLSATILRLRKQPSDGRLPVAKPKNRFLPAST